MRQPFNPDLDANIKGDKDANFIQFFSSDTDHSSPFKRATLFQPLDLLPYKGPQRFAIRDPKEWQQST